MMMMIINIINVLIKVMLNVIHCRGTFCQLFVHVS